MARNAVFLTLFFACFTLITLQKKEPFDEVFKMLTGQTAMESQMIL